MSFLSKFTASPLHNHLPMAQTAVFCFEDILIPNTNSDSHCIYMNIWDGNKAGGLD